MTCIIGLTHNNKICLAGDTAITTYLGVVAETTTKIAKYSKCLVGFSGAKSIQNLMEERKEIFDCEFSTKDLNNIWKNLVECTPANQESEILISNGVDLFWMGNIASWRLVHEEFECIGNGGYIAKGAMEALKEFVDDPERRLLKSLDVVSKYCTGVKAPFHLEWISK